MAHTHKHGIYGLSRVGGHAAAAAADGDLFFVFFSFFFFFDFPGVYAGRKKSWQDSSAAAAAGTLRVQLNERVSE